MTVVSNRYIPPFLIIILLFLSIQESLAQTEVAAWGNIMGIRQQGQLFDFETSLRLVDKDWKTIKATAKEAQRPKFKREGATQTVTTSLDSVFFTEQVTDVAEGEAKVELQYAGNPSFAGGVFFTVKLPQRFNKGKFSRDKGPLVAIEEAKIEASDVDFTSPEQSFKLQFANKRPVIIRRDSASKESHYILYIPLSTKDLKVANKGETKFNISASGIIDKQVVHLKVDTSQIGRNFAGFGGNFRLQNPKVDPQVIDYCLKNMRVAWGRVEMPWQLWHPDPNVDPTKNAKAGNLNPHVKESMEMAQRLHQLGMPVIVTAWSGPKWAVLGEPRFRPSPEGVWGNPLNPAKINEIYKSITDYILYLKQNYGVEPAMFSFNESDLGINIRQTGQEHAELIKGLGAYFVSKGLKTKLLLGDNSDATTYEFIYPALADKETHQYIGAISFHSWRGWGTETLKKWAQAADELKKPLIVGEGSIDAAAWAYPAIFQEQSYALEEINLYTRLLSICQPETILQWQLTADYSPLAGGGIFGDFGPIDPTQRFWNLKQLASTPANLKAISVSNDRPNISCAALGDGSVPTSPNAMGLFLASLVI